MNASNRFKKLIRAINWYPPYLFSGIKVIDYSPDFRMFKVRLKLTWYNGNLIGTAFGGSLYSMCDPFFMFILLSNLGEEYIVWDKYAHIEFVKPGKGTVFAIFSMTEEEVNQVKNIIDDQGRHIFEFPCEVKDVNGNLIAKLKKGVYVKKKDFQKLNS
ncbi:YiiD C-terminal domain-containing protein [Algoriphagus lutimaris]|uniref:DUF4442 domain-containing protein n=1 Tax=Algoriphagus lutimaris TaxID=613197 RepID=UPI00196ACD84|nr:DUF4442 domain-containing protein [Algoriphagus lutimaris]MBN3519543.1 YiiD C-terminal domain-containing protein [Algoriphagus lutimaris]